MTKQGDDDAIRGVYRSISEAWGRGDAKGIVDNFAAEGDLIDPFGREARKKENVKMRLEENFGGMFRHSRIVFEPETIRLITPAVAVADGTWEVIFPPQPSDGQAPPPITGLVTSVFRKVDGKWKIEADRPMQKTSLPHGEEPPPSR